MVQLSAFFLSAVLLASTTLAAPPILKRDFSTVQADLVTLGQQATALDNAITAFPNTGGTIVQALTIHSDVQTLSKSFTTSTADVNATGPVNETEGIAIIESVQSIVPTILDGLDVLITKKAAFEALPVSGIIAFVAADLNNLNNATTAFGHALIANAPADLVANATAILNTLGTAYANAIAVYSTP